jgi:DNA-binding NtrC family response regulator
MQEKKVWFVSIEIPKELMNDVKEGSIDLAEKSIDLNEIDDAYDDDLDKEQNQDENQENQQMGAEMQMGPGAPGPLPQL